MDSVCRQIGVVRGIVQHFVPICLAAFFAQARRTGQTKGHRDKIDVFNFLDCTGGFRDIRVALTGIFTP